MRMDRNRSDSVQLASSLLSQQHSFQKELRDAEMDLNNTNIQPSLPQQQDVDRVGTPPEGDLEPLSPSPERGHVSEEERRWRRMTYPAGRIYHLVPARLVFGARLLQ